MGDPLSPTERSERMARVRSRGNASTELNAVATLRAHHISGWRRHPGGIPGTPDLYFPKQRLALFLHGCFWHSCPRCARRSPVGRREFWAEKLSANRRRDARVRRRLHQVRIGAMVVWEHELRGNAWVRRLRRRLAREG